MCLPYKWPRVESPLSHMGRVGGGRVPVVVLIKDHYFAYEVPTAPALQLFLI